MSLASGSYEALGRLVGAKRPTVSLALGNLCDRGPVVRRIDGSWLLTAGRGGH